jgi:hypothetical protein
MRIENIVKGGMDMRIKKAKWMTVGALALALTVGAGAWLADGVVNAADSNASTSTQATASDATKDTSNWKWAGDRGGRGGHGGQGGFGMVFADESVATALGLTADELKTELQAGKTLADIAKEKSVDVTKVTSAVAVALKAKLDAALADGKLTQAQYDEQAARLTEKATSIVNGEKPDGMGFGGGHGPGGPGGHGAFGMVFADESVATALGLTADELKTELHAGKTLADIAKEKSVDVSKVTSAVAATLKAKLDAALADGKLTQAQYDEQSEKLTEKATSIVNGEKPDGMGFGGGCGPGGPGGFGMVFADGSVATALGLTADELKTELQAGKTLADIAKEKSVDVTKVTSAVAAALKAKLDAALADGRLTQAQYDEQSAKLTEVATSIINGEKPDGMGFGHGRRGHSGPGGPVRGAGSNSDSSTSATTSAT